MAGPANFDQINEGRGMAWLWELGGGGHACNHPGTPREIPTSEDLAGRTGYTGSGFQLRGVHYASVVGDTPAGSTLLSPIGQRFGPNWDHFIGKAAIPPGVYSVSLTVEGDYTSLRRLSTTASGQPYVEAVTTNVMVSVGSSSAPFALLSDLRQGFLGVADHFGTLTGTGERLRYDPGRGEFVWDPDPVRITAATALLVQPYRVEHTPGTVGRWVGPYQVEPPNSRNYYALRVEVHPDRPFTASETVRLLRGPSAEDLSEVVLDWSTIQGGQELTGTVGWIPGERLALEVQGDFTSRPYRSDRFTRYPNGVLAPDWQLLGGPFHITDGDGTPLLVVSLQPAPEGEGPAYPDETPADWQREPFPWNLLPPEGPWPDWEPFEPDWDGEWGFDPFDPWDTQPRPDVGVVYVMSPRVVARATARVQLPIGDLWDLPDYPEPYLGQPGVGTTIPEGQGIRRERWALFEVDPYLVAHGTAIRRPTTRLVTARSRVGLLARSRTDVRPAPGDVAVPLEQRWLPAAATALGWSGGPTGSATPTTAAYRGLQRDALTFSGAEWLRVPAGAPDGLTVVLVARLRPSPLAPHTVLLSTPADADPAPLPWSLRAGSGGLAIGLPGRVLPIEAAPARPEDPVLVAVALDPTGSRLRLLTASAYGRVSRELRTPYAYTVQRDLWLGRPPGSVTAPTAARMDLLELGLSDRALSFAELDDVAAALDLAYGITA